MILGLFYRNWWWHDLDSLTFMSKDKKFYEFFSGLEMGLFLTKNFSPFSKW